MKRNMGTIDRLVRGFVVAPAAIAWAATVGWSGVWAVTALAAAGVMLLTALIGFCPLYAMLGIDTTGRRTARA
jgi:Protein of unknown function (DUF2892)